MIAAALYACHATKRRIASEPTLPRQDISSAGRTQPTPPIAQCSGAGGVPPSLQMQAEVLELDF